MLYILFIQDDNEEEDDFGDGFDSEVYVKYFLCFKYNMYIIYCFSPLNIMDNVTNAEDNDDNVSLKLVSAKDFFEDEAELSESDWSSDDEDKLIGINDILEEEEGDKDKLDENMVKSGLDKIYM